MMTNPLDATTLERIIPDEILTAGATGTETLKLHMERYNFAASNLMPGSVLDMACGVGYGTALMAARNSSLTQATGVDISAEAIQYATQRYGSSRISFCAADAMTFQSPTAFDNVVSLETIEHVEHPRLLFSNLVRLVASGGHLIASVPTTPSVDANPHHKSNFSVASFLRMAKDHPLSLVNSFEQIQRFSPVALAMKTEPRSASVRQNLALFYIQNPSHLLLRMWATVRYGFQNRYITVVWQKA